MADQSVESSRVSTTFPSPPPFWRDFTPDKLSRYETLRGAHASRDDNVSRLPAGLVNLQPPPEPTNGKWRVFGEEQSLSNELQSLEDAGIRHLAPLPSDAGISDEGKHADRAFELKKMAKSLLLNFLELIGTISINPAEGPQKVADIRDLFINIHHALNEYRPHEARESLIVLMQEQLDRKRAETAAIRASVDRAKRVLEGLGSIVVPSPPQPQAFVPPAASDRQTALSQSVGPGEGRANADAAGHGNASFWDSERALWEVMDGEAE